MVDLFVRAYHHCHHRRCHRCYCFLCYMEWKSTNNATVRHLGHRYNDDTYCDQSLGSHFQATQLSTDIAAHKRISVEWSTYRHPLPSTSMICK